MKIKSKKIGAEIVKELSKIMVLESRGDILKNITITGCDVTDDSSFAKIYYTYMGNASEQEVKNELEKSKSFLRRSLSANLKVRHTPELLFSYDSSVEYGTKIEQLIQKIHKEE